MKYLGNTYAKNLFICLQNSILTGWPEFLFDKFGNSEDDDYDIILN